MARHKSLLIPMRWVTAGRARKCYHSAEHLIQRDDELLEVKVGIGWHGYCMECAKAMIDQSESALREHSTNCD